MVLNQFHLQVCYVGGPKSETEESQTELFIKCSLGNRGRLDLYTPFAGPNNFCAHCFERESLKKATSAEFHDSRGRGRDNNI